MRRPQSFAKPARRNLEDELQLAVAQLLDSLGWFWWHTPNGGKRGKIEAARFKALGVKAGVADVTIAEPWHHGDNGGPMVAIELKGPGGRLQPTQREWLHRANRRGWLVAVCRTIDEVLDVLQFVEPTNGRKPILPPRSISDPRQIDWTR
jgi:hypothetical protein